MRSCAPPLTRLNNHGENINAWVSSDGLGTALVVPEEDDFLQELSANGFSVRRVFDDLMLCSEVPNCLGLGSKDFLFSQEMKPSEPSPNLTKRDELRLAYYSEAFAGNFGTLPMDDPNELNRTWEGRLSDHEALLKELPDGLRKELKLNNPNQKLVFFDIGPGIANQDLKIGDGEGKPAITSQEMAREFPEMQVAVLDLPSEVDHFTGRKLHKNYPKIQRRKKAELLGLPNIHIVRGDGLVSLADQWRNPRTNPYPRRTRMNIQLEDTTVIVRTANAIDIYCDWEKEVKPALIRMAEDFKDQPVLLLFNREILIKPAGDIRWEIIGRVSNAGFDHVFRDGGREDTQGKPFILY